MSSLDLGASAAAPVETASVAASLAKKQRTILDALAASSRRKLAAGPAESTLLPAQQVLTDNASESTGPSQQHRQQLGNQEWSVERALEALMVGDDVAGDFGSAEHKDQELQS